MEFKSFMFASVCQWFLALCNGNYFDVLKIDINDVVSPITENKKSAKSLLDCTRHCAKAESCKSVLYGEIGGECQLHSNLVVLRASAEIPSLASYYVFVQVRQVGNSIIASRKHAYIILTPLKPHFYILKLGFTGVYISFAQKHRLWVFVRTASVRRF